VVAAGLALWCLVLFLVMVVPTSASRPFPFRWGKTELAYSTDAAVAGYVANGVAAWTSSSGLTIAPGGSDIVVVVAPLRPPIIHSHQAAQANVAFYGQHIASCEIRVDAHAFFALNDFGRQNVITHELGHCLGMDHSDQPSVMLDPLFYSFSRDDAAGIASVYPPRSSSPQVQAPPAAALPEPAVPQPPVVDQDVLAFAAGTGPAPRALSVTGTSPAMPLVVVPAAAMAAAAAQARAFAGPLSDGWTLITWTGPRGSPAACGCSEVLQQAGAAWRRWATGADAAENTLHELVPGVTYLVFR
jgi:hypothetical protein